MAKNTIDFEQELYKAFGQVADFSLGMRIAERFYRMGYEAARKKIDDEVMRMFMEDFQDGDEAFTEACQGAVSRVHMYIGHFMDKED